MDIINCYVPEGEKTPNKSNKTSKKSYIIISIIFIVISLTISALILKSGIDRWKIYNTDKLVLISEATEYPNRYFSKETKGYLIEVLPQGESYPNDNIHVENNERIIKTTWYNKSRTKVECNIFNVIDVILD